MIRLLFKLKETFWIKWDTEQPSANFDNGKILCSMVINQELFTFQGYSCRLKDMMLCHDNGLDIIKITFSVPSRARRVISTREIVVPEGKVQEALCLYNHLKQRYTFSPAWGQKSEYERRNQNDKS